MQRLGKFVSLPFREQLLFLEALSLQLWIGLVLKIIPFRWIPRVFADANSMEHPPAGGQVEAWNSGINKPGTRNREPGTLIFLKAATQRASKASPWKNKCLVSSLAVRCMLRRRKITSQISLGVAKDAGGRTIAHAWLMAGDFEIVARDGDYHPLYVF